MRPDSNHLHQQIFYIFHKSNALNKYYSNLFSAEIFTPIFLGNFSTYLSSTDVLNIVTGKFMVLQVITPGIFFL